MAFKPGRFLKIALIAAMLFIGGIAIGLIPVNLFFAKKAVSEWVLENSGFQLQIEGPMRLRLGASPALTASRILISKANESVQPFLRAENLLLRTRLTSLIRGELDIRQLRVDGIEHNLCNDSECVLDLLPSELNFEAVAPLQQALSLEIRGTETSSDFRLIASGSSLSNLLNDPVDYSFELELLTFSSVVRTEGELHTPLSNPHVNTRIEIQSEHVGDLLGFFGLEAGDFSTFSAQSELRVSHEEFSLENLRGNLDDIGFSINGRVRDYSARPQIDVEGQLEKLDLEGLYSAEHEQHEPAAGDLDLEPLLNHLLNFDGNLRLKIGQLTSEYVSADELAVQARLDQGHLVLERADMFLAGSPLEVSGELNIRMQCPQLLLDLQAHDLDLKLLNQWLRPAMDFGGEAKATSLVWNSCGNTLREHISSMQLQADITQMTVLAGPEYPALDIENLHVSTAWKKPGLLKLSTKLAGQPFTVDFSFGDIQTLVAGSNWPVALQVVGSQSQLEVSGNALFGEQEIHRLNLVLTMETDRAGSLHWIGIDQENKLPLSVDSQLVYGPDGLRIDNLRIVLGNSDIQGRLDWPGANELQPMVVNLHSGKLAIDELAGLLKQSEEPSGHIPAAEQEQLSPTDWINKWLGFPAATVDVEIDELSGLSPAVHEIHLRAQLNDRLVENGYLKLRLAEADFLGSIDMDFRESPGRARYEVTLDNVDVGRLLADLGVAEGKNIHAEHAEIVAFSEGNTLLQLASNLQIEALMRSLNWNFTAGPQNTQNRLELEILDLLVSPGEQSSWKARGALNDFPLRVYLKSPSPHTILDASKNLPLTMVIGAGEDLTILEAVIDQRTTGKRHAQIRLSGGLHDQNLVDFSDLTYPLEEYEIDSEVTWGDQALQFRNLRLKTGESTLNGSVDLRFVEPGYFLDIEVHSPFLETDDLVNWAEDYRNSVKILHEEEERIPGKESTEAGFFGMIAQQFDTFVESFDYKIQADIDELRSSGNLLGKASLASYADRNDVKLNLDIDRVGENLRADYLSTISEQGVDYSLNLFIERLEYGGLMNLLNPEAQGSGQVYVDASLTSSASDPSRLAEHLNGHFDMVVIPRNLGAAFLDLWASNLIFALLPIGDDSKKKMNCMVARFDVKEGIMSSNNTFLDSTDIIVRARGDIDLVNRRLDLLAVPQAKVEKFLSVQAPLKVSGPFDDFSVGLAPGSFITTMIRWYYSLIYVPWKWLTGERFPADGLETCFNAMEWETPESISAR